MLRIVINEVVDSAEDMAQTLRHIADLLDKGNTSGYSPTWVIDELSSNTKQDKIDRIKEIIHLWGSTNVCELELDGSPCLASIGNGHNNVSQLVEAFYIDNVGVTTYHDDMEPGDTLLPYSDLPDDILNEVLDIIERYNTEMNEK